MKREKKEKQSKPLELPSIEQLEMELGREKYRWRFRKVLRSTIYALITVAAAAVLVATLWMPVLQISGNSMAPTLTDGEVVISFKGGSNYQPGDIVAFYYDNKILVKRVIAGPGDWVDIDEKGTVFVNEQELYEPYLVEKALGDCNITLPYQVPESKLFVMGDHRSVSLDSRNTALGCVASDQIVGQLVFRVWPHTMIGPL
ncbi:MAG: signal peptidase I [Oscillibacter sp.]|jgi:signal peptidase I|nr:signal peptidase I [Oscillibacter sp.]